MDEMVRSGLHTRQVKHTTYISVTCTIQNVIGHVCAQGIYNQLLLVWIVGSVCLQRHQLAAMFIASLSVFQMKYEISQINKMGREGYFDDAHYVLHETSETVLPRLKKNHLKDAL